MTEAVYGAAALAHGALGLAGVALAARIAWRLGRAPGSPPGGPPLRLAAASAVLLLLPSALGLALYPLYRVEVRPLLMDGPSLSAFAALGFEWKEHLGPAAAALAASAAAGLALAPADPAICRHARRAFLAAAILGAATAGLGLLAAIAER